MFEQLRVCLSLQLPAPCCGFFPPLHPASDPCLQILLPCSWYRRAGLVFWPKANRLAVTIRYDPTRQVLRLYRLLVRRHWWGRAGVDNLSA